jgi:hypothetical protein
MVDFWTGFFSHGNIKDLKLVFLNLEFLSGKNLRLFFRMGPENSGKKSRPYWTCQIPGAK